MQIIVKFIDVDIYVWPWMVNGTYPLRIPFLWEKKEEKRRHSIKHYLIVKQFIKKTGGKVKKNEVSPKIYEFV